MDTIKQCHQHPVLVPVLLKQGSVDVCWTNILVANSYLSGSVIGISLPRCIYPHMNTNTSSRTMRHWWDVDVHKWYHWYLWDIPTMKLTSFEYSRQNHDVCQSSLGKKMCIIWWLDFILSSRQTKYSGQLLCVWVLVAIRWEVRHDDERKRGRKRGERERATACPAQSWCCLVGSCGSFGASLSCSSLASAPRHPPYNILTSHTHITHHTSQHAHHTQRIRQLWGVFSVVEPYLINGISGE